ncbi:hypothetical protein G6O69_24835 [Pseudenhygromyxa sp. WMMC2535]|nr:hypothetical protein [Pseudenhygromyxa sp. WMMC2535]
MTVAEYVELSREMMRVRLEETLPERTPEVARAADAVEAAADAAADAMATLGEAHDPQCEAVEVAFEASADDLAGMLDAALSYWSSYLVAQRVVWSGDNEPEGELARQIVADDRMLATRGKGVYEGFFGEGGQDFFKLPYVDRFRELSAWLRTLTDADGETNYGELLRRPFNELVPLMRLRYEHDLELHMAGRDDSHGLAEHRATMRLALARYAHELRQAPDRLSKESCERVNTALQPLEDRCRQLRVRH